MNDRSHAQGPFSPANDVSAAFNGTLPGNKRRADPSCINPPINRIDRPTLSRVFQLVDGGIMACLVATAVLVYMASFWPMLVFVGVAAAGLRLSSVYRIRARRSAWQHVAFAVIALGMAGTATILLARLADPAIVLAASQLSGVGAATLLVVHCIYAFFIEFWARQGRLASNVVVVGATANARRLIEANGRSKSINILGVFDDRQTRSPSTLAGAPYLGTLQELSHWPLLHEVDRIVVTVTPHAVDRVRELLARLSGLPQPVSLLLDFENFNPKRQKLEDIANVSAARLSGQPASPGWVITKRLQDLLIGSAMFLAALPVMAVLAVLIKLDSPGPVLFRQKREGFNGRLIEVLKFRSMRNDPAPKNGAVRQVERDDPRVTRIGKFIRKTSLDELPQLWNVLKGDMSLVGPRPHAPGMRTGAALTSSLVGEYAHRHRVKPGLTGWAQVNGSRGPLHTPESARERIRYDVEYIARASLWFDLWIMLRTGPALLGDSTNIR
ncbi:exopolysaccharide biosynthesis polyprenyl glycosylphosphotransferase [Hyphobacterium sp.]|uniref:exopolysaccharide biosynthesis polyprenyl glycosylphosphotransferase n=1 Tax=Hyphobacterium sp. TaxID=2004662 RepID=UPI003BA8E36D